MPSFATSGSRRDPLLQDAASYLEDTAPARGGRNSRPLAIPALVTSYVASERTLLGAASAACGVLAGVAAWFGLTQRDQAEPSVVLLVVGLVLALALLAVAVLLGVRVLRTGAVTIAALQRWHAVAPEVPVRGADVLTQGPGLARLVLSVVAVLAGLGAVVAGPLLGTFATLMGGAIAGLTLLTAGAGGLLGWWRVRGLLETAAPQDGSDAFAPAPHAAQPGTPGYAPQAQQEPWRPTPPPPTTQPPWAQGYASAPSAQQPYASPSDQGRLYPPDPSAPQQPVPASRPVQPRPDAQPAPAPWAPPPPQHQPQNQPSAPWQPPPGVVVPANPAETWGPAATVAPPSTSAPPSADDDLHDTRLASGLADTTLGSRTTGVVVVLADGTPLRGEVITLIGRDPQPRDDDPEVERARVVHPTVSKTHAAFRVTDTSVHVTDRASTNGVTVVGPDGSRRRIAPWAEEAVLPGSAVLLGSYRIEVREQD